MSSILTNSSAMTALSTLRGINSDLDSTQNRISTGLKVQSAKDNAAYFSISKKMSAESGTYKAINESMTLAKNSLSTGRLAAETVQGLAQQFVERVAFAQNNSGTELTDIESELTSLAKQMTSAIEQASFNNTNLVDGSETSLSVTTGQSTTIDIDLANTDLNDIVGDATAGSETGLYEIAKQVGAAATGQLSAAKTELGEIVKAATALGVGEKAVETQQEFLSQLSDRLDAGVGAMVDANMEEEAARLQALQVQQQLSTQSLSIANQAPQNILSLFR